MLLRIGLHIVVLIPNVSLPQIAQGWQKAFPEKKFNIALLDHLGQKEVDVADWKAMPEKARNEYLKGWRAQYQGRGGWVDGWSIFLEGVPSKHFPLLNCQYPSYCGLCL